MLTNNATANQKQPPPILALAFRPFFLLGASFSILALLIWIAVLSGRLDFQPYGNGFWWHSHEMLFGFVAAIVVGFLLTAVQNWTGIPGVKGWRLFYLVALWLTGRAILLVNPDLSPWIVAAIDFAFIPSAAYFLAMPILAKKMYRNLIFIPLLIAMSLSNFVMHWGLINQDMLLAAKSSYAMIMLVTLLMCIMAGRVIPMFTANGTGTQKVNPNLWIERLSIGSMILVALIFISGVSLPSELMALVTLLAGIIHLVRFIRWRFWVTTKVPLVWSLHISYFCIPLGMILLSSHYLFNQITFSAGLHVLTVGAMGTMILAMISRVSLGHTGRMIVVGKVMAAAFLAVTFAFIVRVFGTSLSDDYIFILTLSAALWSVAYGLFVIRYFMMLIRKRADGRPG
ncbi:NnrS family protein [Aliikangiella coralliicola]|uniref:NnrS family protein n=1 Tax=Aliikangiella coralliicola TaxID=2592383 RepID=A0A545U4H2_9GAMM|nr:NnrS family protein [Aliikangiella coralliicola]TQV84380.1 NnrS family protein [Aliikangiella coralliicola]